MSALPAILAVLAIIALLMLSYRFPWWRRPVGYQHPRILTYHMIADRTGPGPIGNLAVSPRQFERQLRWMSRRGWRFATVGELLDGPPAGRTVALTFDDGYADNLTAALPILRRYNARGTVFVIADRANPLSGGGYPDGRPFAPLMTDDQLDELHRSGLIEIGAHTVTHRNLADTDEATAREEIGDAKDRLGSILGRSIRGFAYPYSVLNDTAVRLVREAGYGYAVAGGGLCTDLEANRFHIQRVRISGRDNFLNFLIKLRIGRRR